MPDFAYTARDSKGQKVTGKVSAGSQREAVNIISGKALFPVEVVAQQPAKQLFSFGGRVGGNTMSVAYGQLASLLRSGVPLLRSILVLADQSSNSRLKTVLNDVHDQVEDGVALGDAMAKHPLVFSEMSINMVRAGAEGGFLEDALERVATFTEQAEDLKSRTAGALAYPVFLGSVGSIVVTCLIVFFVPMFAVMFDRMRKTGDLPWMTDALLTFSDALRTWTALGVFIGAVVGVIVLWRMSYTPRGRRISDLIKIKIPMAGGIFLNLAVSRFCRVLGTLLKNGVPILKSLEISREAAGNRILSEAVEDASDNITAGESLAVPLGQSGHFPKTVVEMISVAEESNTLDTVLVNISDGLERRTYRRLDLMVKLLEPMMLVVLAGVVLFVVLALLLPILSMSSAL